MSAFPAGWQLCPQLLAAGRHFCWLQACLASAWSSRYLEVASKQMLAPHLYPPPTVHV